MKIFFKYYGTKSWDLNIPYNNKFKELRSDIEGTIKHKPSCNITKYIKDLQTQTLQPNSALYSFSKAIRYWQTYYSELGWHLIQLLNYRDSEPNKKRKTKRSKNNKCKKDCCVIRERHKLGSKPK